MRNAPQNISVEINVTGPVTNSEIVGVRLGPTAPFKQVRSSLFSVALFEYLRLPSLTEVLSHFDRVIAMHTGDYREYDFDRAGLEYLWMSVLQDNYSMAHPGYFMRGELNTERERKITAPLHEGQWLRLHNVQLTPFVNRSPGKFYRGGWELSSGHEEVDRDLFVVSEHTWTYEDFAVRTMGLGDVRFGELDGYYLMQCMDRQIIPKNASYVFALSNAALSALGFPIVVDYSFYKRIAPLIDNFGSAYIEQLDVKLCRASRNARLLWAPGVPKLVLAASGRISAKGIAEPHPGRNAIWTVAADDDLQTFHYCTWGFQTGVPDYRSSLETAVTVINDAIKKRGLRALFEFDAETNWFGDNTPFTPLDMLKLSRKVDAEAPLRNRADLVTYATQYDVLVARNTRPNGTLEIRNLICQGLAALDFRDYSTASAYLEEANRLLPANDFVQFELGAAEYLSGNVHQGIATLKELVGRNPKSELGRKATNLISEFKGGSSNVS